MKNTTVRLLVYAIFNGEIKFEDDDWCNVAVYNDEHLLKEITKMTLVNVDNNKNYNLSTLTNLSINSIDLVWVFIPGKYQIEFYDNDNEDYLHFYLE